MQVIKSAAESGDGVSIEREQPSTAFRSMPHIISFVKPQPIDELTGTFDAQMGELRSDHLTFKAQPINELTGEGRPMNVWTNGSATSFEDKHVGDYDANDVGIQEGCGQNVPIGSRFPGIDRSIKGIQVVYFENIGGTAGPGGSTYMTETFEPAVGMNSFGESLNPVLEIGGTAGPGGSSFMTGQFEMPTDNIGSTSGPGGTSF